MASTRTSERDPGAKWRASFPTYRRFPEDFGALGDDGKVDDDAMAAWVAHARAIGSRSLQFSPGAKYYMRRSLDLTGFSHLSVMGNGAEIISFEVNHPVVDMTNTRNSRVENLRIYAGTPAAPARRGLQLAIRDTGPNAPGNTLVGVDIDGYYYEAPLFNQGSEVARHFGCIFRNQYETGERYGIILDGSAHWPIRSRYVTIVRTPDAFVSNNSGEFYACDVTSLGTGGTGGAVWLSGSADHKFEGGYCQVFGNRPAVTVYCGGTGSAMTRLRNFRWNIHTEVQPSAMFFFTGAAAIEVSGLQARDHLVQVADGGHYFKRDAGVNTVAIHDAQLHLWRWLNNGARMFDDPSAFTIEGDVSIDAANAAVWNEADPGTFARLHTNDHTPWSLPGRSTALFAANGGRSPVLAEHLALPATAALADGATYAVPAAASAVLLTPAGGSIAAGTIDLPTPDDNRWRRVQVIVNGTITNLSVTSSGGGARVGFPATVSGYTAFQAVTDGTDWFCT
jgi:hypothetical protein